MRMCVVREKDKGRMEGEGGGREMGSERGVARERVTVRFRESEGGGCERRWQRTLLLTQLACLMTEAIEPSSHR
jgi:hypothetical protein